MSLSPAPTVEAAQPPRSRLVAVLLTLIAPGSGHVYAGRVRRGLLVLATMLVPHAIMIAGARLVPPSFMAITAFAGVLALLLLAVYLFAVIDAFRIARRPGAATKWYAVVAAVLAVWLAGFAMTLAIKAVTPYQPWRTFTVPSSSMEPTLRLGDWFIADTHYFRTHEPARGDVVVYRLPSDPSTIYVKRIVGLAGDRVQFRDGRVIVNGKTITEPYIRAGDPKMTLNNTTEYVVPPGHFFAAGDNRANSADSRMQSHGFVPVQNLVGRATEIFMSRSEDRQGLWIGTPRDSQFWS